MYVSIAKKKGANGKIYTSTLLRRSYREGNKVKNETIASLTHCSEEEIQAISNALKNVNQPMNPPSKAPVLESFKSRQGKSVGSIWVIEKLASSLGITEALGDSFHARLILWLIIARIIDQGSRLSAVRLDIEYDLASVLKLQRGFDENDLYDALRWISNNQSQIEDKLYERRKSSSPFFFYDVSSSYLEGVQNAFAEFGYNRDNKKRKKQIVFGLLCQDEGWPVSVEAFSGNTQDTETVDSQLVKIQTRFKCKEVVLVGDRGMIRPKQKTAINSRGYNYITALTMPQMEKLVNDGVIKFEDFSHKLKSMTKDGVRYIYRKNHERAETTGNDRDERLETVLKHVNNENARLHEKPNTSVESAHKRMTNYAKRLCIHEWTEIKSKGRTLYIEIQAEKYAKKSKYDGCYVWTTDLPEVKLSDRQVYERYKDLKYAEDAFRDIKTEYLEIRPLHVRTEESTRGHFVVTMLSYMILKALQKAWNDLNITVEGGLNLLSKICQNTMEFASKTKLDYIPEPSGTALELLERLNLTLPTTINKVHVPVVTRKKVRKGA